MKFALVALALFCLLNVAFASQQLAKNSFLYNNVTIGNAQTAIVGVNASSDIVLEAIPSGQLSNYINDEPITAAYNKTVPSGVYQLDLASGSYTIISFALRPTTLNIQIATAPANQGTLITLNGEYSYNFSLENYSNVNLTLISSADFSRDPLFVNVSGVAITLNSSDTTGLTPVTLNRGEQSLVLSAPSKMQLFILINSTPELVNPLTQVTPGGNYSIGVASYGLYNVSGRLYPYQVLTNEVVGVANISSLHAYTLNPPPNSSDYGAGLQLNTGLNTYIDNKLRVFWLQDVVDFNTSSNEFYLIDNIWNNTNPNATLMPSALVGSGNLSSCSSCDNQSFYVDSYPNYDLNYSFPISLKLVVLENQTPQGSQVNFGYQVLRNGTSGLGPLIFFDHVLIPQSSNTTLITTPYYETPGGGASFGNYYDTEFVFGGESGGANSDFAQTQASMWIYYNNGTALAPFPSVYTFGLSTAESATGIETVNSSGGALVMTGSPHFSTDLFAGAAPSNMSDYVTNTSSYTSQPTTTAQGFVIPPINPGSLQVNGLIIVMGIAVAFILIVGFFLLRRHA